MPLTWNPYASYDNYVAPLTGYNIPPMSETMGNLQRPSLSSLATSLPKDAVASNSVKGRMSQLTPNEQLSLGTEAVMGVVNLAADAGTIGSQKLNLGKPSTMYYEEGVAPTYRTGEYFNRAFYARPMGATGAEIANTGLKTAATGSKIGMMVGGPAGAAIGAGVGAVVGAGTAAIAGGVRKRRQQREKEKALNLARGQQQTYNTRALDFSQQQTAMNEYRRRNDPYERMSNFYTA